MINFNCHPIEFSPSLQRISIDCEGDNLIYYDKKL